jgi:predicted ABC-type ATPase
VGERSEISNLLREDLSDIKSLFNLYSEEVDSILIYDNSSLNPELIAEKEMQQHFKIIHNEKFIQLQKIANE